jgi:hypothetical protein
VGDRFAAGGGRGQVEAAVAQQFVQRRQQARFVVDEQQARLLHVGNRGLVAQAPWGDG